MIEICDAILDMGNGRFCMCEKEKDHTGNHRGLHMEWLGEGTTYADPKDIIVADVIMHQHIVNCVNKVSQNVDM